MGVRRFPDIWYSIPVENAIPLFAGKRIFSVRCHAAASDQGRVSAGAQTSFFDNAQTSFFDKLNRVHGCVPGRLSINPPTQKFRRE